MNRVIPALQSLLGWNTLGLRSSWHKGQELLKISKEVFDSIQDDQGNIGGTLEMNQLTSLKTAFTNFEITFKADLAVANLYVLTSKGAFDTGILAEFGIQAFPDDLGKKVPDAVNDAQQAGRCIAFDLPTSAAFHMHRAHEAVVHAYFKALVPTEKSPERQALSAWVQALEKADAPKEIVAAVRDINTLHRNPVLHPEHTLKDSGEAIALLGSIHTSMRYMLPTIPGKEQLS
ncbi:hypothetical protein [Rhodoferax sp.]|uniref:hypothetical protein n=1 Tax=Rhodoferax sp. TaxID=50421 RepID=UPI00271E9DE0|nr:hypothetical protein [Rhodoferax sp.]MDO8318767.1 hypothetical protein [Rhodoferax sp.]